jgi:hypothetical protein
MMTGAKKSGFSCFPIWMFPVSTDAVSDRVVTQRFAAGLMMIVSSVKAVPA